MKVTKEEFLNEVDSIFKEIRTSIGMKEEAYTFLYLRELEEKIKKYFDRKEKPTKVN